MWGHWALSGVTGFMCGARKGWHGAQGLSMGTRGSEWGHGAFSGAVNGWSMGLWGTEWGRGVDDGVADGGRGHSLGLRAAG